MKTIAPLAMLCQVVTAYAAAPAPDLILRDTLTDKEFRTYRLLPFDVPANVKALEIRFDYTGRDARTTIDVGLLGPGEKFDNQFRGWSGGNKRSFALSASDATPSYLSGPVTPGRWQLLLGVPNIPTVVYAKELSIDGIIAGIRAGNVFVDTAGTRDRKLELTATHNRSTAVMGGQLSVPAEQSVTFTARIDGGRHRRNDSRREDGSTHSHSRSQAHVVI